MAAEAVRPLLRESTASLEWSLRVRQAAVCTCPEAVPATFYHRCRRYCLQDWATKHSRQLHPPLLQTSIHINTKKLNGLDQRTRLGSTPLLPCHYSYECTIQPILFASYCSSHEPPAILESRWNRNWEHTQSYVAHASTFAGNVRRHPVQASRRRSNQSIDEETPQISISQS